MKLAEALVERKNLAGQIAETVSRLVEASVVVNGETPEEDAEDLLNKLFGLLDSQEELIVNINHTNNVARLSDGQTLMEAIAERDITNQRVKYLGVIIAQIKSRRDRTYRPEGETVALAEGITIKKLQQLSDEWAKKHRILDLQIQEAGWLNELQ